MRRLTVLSNDKQEPVSVWKAGNGEIHIQPFPSSYLCVFIKRLITFILLSFDLRVGVDFIFRDRPYPHVVVR